MVVGFSHSYAKDGVDVNTQNRNAVLHITVPLENRSMKGTGFIVSDFGHVVTAWHIIEKYSKTSDSHKKNNPIIARRGSHLITAKGYSLVVLDYNEDFALLKILDQEYGEGKVPTCLPPNDISGRSISIVGFPAGGAYQPAKGLMGDLISGGRYSFSSAETVPGMSGGPVFDDLYESVIGLVSKGSGPATKRMVPLSFGKSILSNFDIDIENCDKASPKPSSVSIGPTKIEYKAQKGKYYVDYKVAGTPSIKKEIVSVGVIDKTHTSHALKLSFTMGIKNQKKTGIAISRMFFNITDYACWTEICTPDNSNSLMDLDALLPQFYSHVIDLKEPKKIPASSSDFIRFSLNIPNPKIGRKANNPFCYLGNFQIETVEGIQTSEIESTICNVYIPLDASIPWFLRERPVRLKSLKFLPLEFGKEDIESIGFGHPPTLIDLNGDGYPELSALDSNSAERKQRLFPNTKSPLVMAPISVFGQSRRIANLNSDEILDSYHVDIDKITFFISDKVTQKWQEHSFEIDENISPYSLWCVDLNEQIPSCLSPTQRGLSLYSYDSEASKFTRKQELALTGGVSRFQSLLFIADFNNDNLNDVLVSSRTENETIYWLALQTSNGLGELNRYYKDQNSNWLNNTQLIDLDKDGFLDGIKLTDEGIIIGKRNIIENSLDFEKISESFSKSEGWKNGLRGFDLCDLNNDGYKDILYRYRSSSFVSFQKSPLNFSGAHFLLNIPGFGYQELKCFPSKDGDKLFLSYFVGHPKNKYLFYEVVFSE